MASDHKDDVDRLFACFKCGTSTPESALKEKKSRYTASSEKPLRIDGNPVDQDKESDNNSESEPLQEGISEEVDDKSRIVIPKEARRIRRRPRWLEGYDA